MVKPALEWPIKLKWSLFGTHFQLLHHEGSRGISTSPGLNGILLSSTFFRTSPVIRVPVPNTGCESKVSSDPNPDLGPVSRKPQKRLGPHSHVWFIFISLKLLLWRQLLVILKRKVNKTALWSWGLRFCYGFPGATNLLGPFENWAPAPCRQDRVYQFTFAFHAYSDFAVVSF